VQGASLFPPVWAAGQRFRRHAIPPALVARTGVG
jgi:hypothetical protein